MIRWLVWGVNDEIARALAKRLHEATIESWLTVPPTQTHLDVAPLESCDAVAFFGHAPIESTLIVALLGAGKHVLLATQSCLNCDELEALSGVGKHSGVQFSVVNPDRFRSSQLLIKQQLDAGKLGDIGLVRLHRWEPVATDSSLSPLRLPSPLVHDLDLVLWLIGKTPDLVYATKQTANQRDHLQGLFIQAHLGFPGGGMALIDYSNQLPAGDGYQSLSVIGSAGAAYSDDHQNTQLLYRGGRPYAVRADEGVKQLTATLQAFIDNHHAGRDMSEGVVTWQKVLTFADAVRRSLDSRQAKYWE